MECRNTFYGILAALSCAARTDVSDAASATTIPSNSLALTAVCELPSTCYRKTDFERNESGPPRHTSAQIGAQEF